MSGDIYKFIERRNVDALAGKVGDYSECCNWMVEDRPVEFGNNVGATLVLQYDYERTEVSRTHFAIQIFLDSGISDEDEVAEVEVILDDGCSMLLFKMDHGFDLSGIHVRGECCQVRLMFLQGNSTPSNKVSQGKRGIGWRKKVCCFGNVEGQKGVCASCCEVQRTAHMSVDCDSVSPCDNRIPPRLVSIAGLE